MAPGLRTLPADPLAEAVRVIALVVVGNQPLYPLTLHWVVGNGGAVACATWLSTPLFAACAWGARRHSLAARLGLPLAGLANTLWSAKLFGADSGVGLFVFPCWLIAVLALRGDEWLWRIAMIGVGAAAMAAVPLAGAHPLAGLSVVELASLSRVNLISVGCLTVFAGFSLLRARRADARLRSPYSPLRP